MNKEIAILTSKKSGGQAHFVYANSAREEDIRALVAKSRETFGPVDILV
jgi:NAD(P)-dependent dehydrogenase (short-subunit alcohol dehydrogenase family)